MEGSASTMIDSVGMPRSFKLVSADSFERALVQYCLLVSNVCQWCSIFSGMIRRFMPGLTLFFYFERMQKHD